MSSRRLTKHKYLDKLTDKHKLQLQKDINASGEVFDLLLEILQSKRDQLSTELLSKTMYESPAYAYKVADISGGIRELNFLTKLLQETEETP
jgi:hypothetical protein